MTFGTKLRDGGAMSNFASQTLNLASFKDFKLPLFLPLITASSWRCILSATDERLEL